MYNNQIYKQAFKQFLIFCLWIASARVSKGFILPLMTLLGVVWAFNGKFGKAYSIYAMLLMMIAINPNILPKNGFMFSLGLRFGPLIIGLALVMRSMTITRKQALPLGVMLAYLVVAVVSSIDGWSPMVSYLKLINFTVFFFGIWLGSKGLQLDEDGVSTLRATLLAIATFLIAGSAALWPFPGISTLNSLKMIGEVEDVVLRNEILREMIDSGGMTLFCGVTAQSQALSPLLACAFAWVVCDLLFVEGRFRWPHIALLILALPLLYLTRSRVALLGLVVTLVIVYFYLPRKIQLGNKMKQWLRHILLIGGLMLIALVVVAEMKDNAISRWVRKTEGVKADQRSLSEAFTASRQGLVDMCMDDFYRNPLFGMGFQVAEYTAQSAAMNDGLILSSPIEKGVIPIMILGETGIVGVVVFAIFLLSFYLGCTKRHLYLSVMMMAVLLSLNLGEATFFSPGGLGGPQWLLCVVGGYVLDLTMMFRKRR